MEANELRVGNLINCNGNQIKVTYHHIRYAQIKSGDSYEPIPLTKEWLLKAGFEYMESDAKNVTMYFISPFAIYAKDYKPNEFYINEGCIAKVIKHVHKLQNVYFALKDKELVFKQ